MSRTVLVLGAVSFLNDTASEMIAPLLPVFLTGALGAGAWVVGLVEGVAEATASLLKLVSGRLVDRGWRHKRLVLGGYGMSNAFRPLIGLASSWPVVALLRFGDRVGKGLRTAPRDAWIALVAPAEARGRSFGFHRAMDNAGAMVGPFLAFLLLRGGVELSTVFLASLVPGILVVGLVGSLEPPVATPAGRTEPLHFKGLDPRLRGLIAASGGLALAAVPEAFLVLWATDRGLEIAWVPLLWAAASAVKAVLAAPAGALSDHLGRVTVLVVGWSLRVGVLGALALVPARGGWVWALFLAWAGVLALTEAAERALVGDLADASQRGSAFGLFHMVVGLAALPGALGFGLVWQAFGAPPAFLAAGAVTAVSAAWMLGVSRNSAAP